MHSFNKIGVAQIGTKHGHAASVLSTILKEEIIDKVDHKNLNIDVPFLEGIITTTENVTIKFWEVLDEKLKSLKNSKCTLHKIRLYETPRNFVEYYGEK